MIVLGLNSGHDSSAALTIDDRRVANCKEKRRIRIKQDAGKPFRRAAIDGVPRIGGVERARIDAIALDRGRLPSRCLIRSADPLKLGWRKAVNRATRILSELSRLGGGGLDIVDADRIRRNPGVPAAAQVVFAIVRPYQKAAELPGACGITASAADAPLNGDLKRRLTRTEFMPFAPSLRDCDAQDVFEIDNRNLEACRFMTVTANVEPQWRDRIPSVVPVDGTARPHLVQRSTNPRYYDILTHFKELTGLPCLVNNSFKAHEEPIINSPDEAIVALMEKRIDFLACNSGVVVNRS